MEQHIISFSSLRSARLAVTRSLRAESKSPAGGFSILRSDRLAVTSISGRRPPRRRWFQYPQIGSTGCNKGALRKPPGNTPGFSILRSDRLAVTTTYRLSG